MPDQSQFVAFVEELRALVNDQVRPCYDWYSTHTTWPRICFRVAAVIVVVGSLALPAIATATWAHHQLVLTVVSLAVAILSSLSTFFKWDSTWQSRTKTVIDLQGFLAKWELALRSAEMAPNPSEAALTATQELFNDVFNTVGSETKQFFSTVKWPEVSKPN